MNFPIFTFRLSEIQVLSLIEPKLVKYLINERLKIQQIFQKLTEELANISIEEC